jgi:hypothetical protein
MLLAVLAAVSLLGAAGCGLGSPDAVARLTSALDRGHQFRTMGHLHAVSDALHAQMQATGGLPAAATWDELARALEPTYIAACPRLDDWGNEMRYETWAEAGAPHYALGAAGHDGHWERARLVDYPDASTPGGDADIVLRDGRFVQWPECARAGIEARARAETDKH